MYLVFVADESDLGNKNGQVRAPCGAAVSSRLHGINEGGARSGKSSCPCCQRFQAQVGDTHHPRPGRALARGGVLRRNRNESFDGGATARVAAIGNQLTARGHVDAINGNCGDTW